MAKFGGGGFQGGGGNNMNSLLKQVQKAQKQMEEKQKELEIKDKNGKIRKKSSKMPSSNKPKIPAPTKRPAEKYGCECDCPACDQGHHKSCKKNCKCGQYI